MTDFKSAKILITGGLGFIGSNLAGKLVNLGADVTLIDSLIPEYGGNLWNIEGFKNKVKVNISDVRDEHSMKYLIQDKDLLFNLAGQTSHLDSMNNPYPDLEINARSQLSILESCRKKVIDTRDNTVFPSVQQAADYFKVHETTLCKYLKGKLKNTKFPFLEYYKPNP